jgi:ketosteroid isomerase-like protein
MTTLAGPDDRTLLLDRDRRFFDALVAADIACLEDLLADDFIMVGINDGATATRTDLLGLMSSGTLQFPAVQSFPDEAVVRRVGDVGIIVGRTSMNFTNINGTVFTAGSRYTHVFASDSIAGWRLISAQGTEIKPGS